MKSPWENIEKAFCPMYGETIGVETKDGWKTSIRAAVFVDGVSDPLSDSAIDTEREDVTFAFMQRDWPFVQGLRRGDILTRTGMNRKYSVSEARRDELMGWVVEAREA